MTREEAYAKFGEAAWGMPQDAMGNVIAPGAGSVGAGPYDGRPMNGTFGKWLAQGNTPGSGGSMPLDVWMDWQGPQAGFKPDGSPVGGSLARLNPATGMVDYELRDDAGFFGEFMNMAKIPLTFAGMAAGAGALNGMLGGLGSGSSGWASMGGGGGFEGLGFVEGAGGGAGVGVGGGLGGQSSGGGMWDWIESLIEGPVPGDAYSPGDLVSGAASNPVAGDAFLPGALAPSQGLGTVAGVPLSSATFLDQLLGGYNPLTGNSLTSGGVSNLLKGLLGGAGTGPGGLFGSGGGGFGGGFGGGLLGTAFNATPFLLALSEANKQGKDLDGVINKINGEGYTKSVLNPYDLQTGLGRGAMENDLGLRGVGGSSFGYQALDNYDYMRNIGRGDLASKALMTSAGLEGSLINTRNTNRNLLLGAGLNASGRLFSPQKDPFGLSLLGA